MTAIGQLMNQRGVAVEREDDGLILGEQRVIIRIAQAVGMLAGGLELHQIHHIDDPHLDLRHILPEDRHRRQRFQCGGIAAAGHHHIRLLPCVIAGPLPDADALGAVLNGLLHGQPLGTGMLAGNQYIDIIPAAGCSGRSS